MPLNAEPPSAARGRKARHRTTTNLFPVCGAVVTQNAMEGDGGGWTVGYGSNWFSSTNLNLGCDEDQVTDTERAHATEPVSYIVFE